MPWVADTLTVGGGSALGNSLQALLMCDEIVPGSEPSYQMCKTIYLYHPLGDKIASMPIRKAQSMGREITIPDGPEEDCKEAFEAEWRRIGSNNIILNVGTQARVYGIASIVLIAKDLAPDAPLDPKKIGDLELSFNVLDPLNTAGSLVLSQDPNAIDFQKHSDIAVNGITYHRSRAVTLMNENPIYIHYTSAAFGFVGRSVYQRGLFPLKSFVQTMIADDMVATKVGLIVSIMKMAGSIIDRMMSFAAGVKRQLIKQGQTNNVITIGEGEDIKSVDLTNLDGPLGQVRRDILENIAAAVPMPAKMINNETFAEGFGEGTEDAKNVADYVDSIRDWLSPLYTFMDMIVQRRAWNPRFFAVIQKKFPDEYGSMSYEEAFYRWSNSFKANWPSLLREPDSELVRVEEVKLKSIIAVGQVFIPDMDPDNKAAVYKWMADNINSSDKTFTTPLELDWEALAAYKPPSPEGELKEPAESKPFAAADESGNVIAMVNARLHRVEDYLRRRRK